MNETDNREEFPTAKDAFIFAIAHKLMVALNARPYSSWLPRGLKVVWSALTWIFVSKYPQFMKNDRDFDDSLFMFWPVYIISLFFCLFLTAIFCYFAGTLYGTDPRRLYFVRDVHNIIIYLIVVPAYSGFCIVFLSTALKCFFELQAYAGSLPQAVNTAGVDRSKTSTQKRIATAARNYAGKFKTRKINIRFGSLIFICIFASSIFIVRYLESLRKIEVSKHIYWFFDFYTTADGKYIRYINIAGAYYLLLNTFLLMMTLICACSFLTVSYELMQLGDLLTENVSYFTLLVKDQEALPKDQRFPRKFLENYAWCYVLVKFLLVIYSVNIILWAKSPAAAAKVNVYAAVILIALFNLVVVPLPRLYFENKWYKILGAKADVYVDIRGRRHSY